VNNAIISANEVCYKGENVRNVGAYCAGGLPQASPKEKRLQKSDRTLSTAPQAHSINIHKFPIAP